MTALANLAVGASNTAIQKNGANSFVNVALNTSNFTLQVNSVNAGSQSLFNLKQGSGISITDDGAGGITITNTNGGGGGGSGTVTSVTSADANATVATTTTTPVITIVSAPKLQNARTIGGVSFDGSANITVATATGGFTVSGGVLAVNAGITASGATSNDFSGGSGTFKTSTGANQLSGAVTVTDATTPSITLAAGSTNTGFLLINGKTSGSLKIITTDATGNAIVITTTAQTVGGTTLTIPNFANVSDTFAFITLAQTLTNKTLSGVTIADATNIILNTTTGTKIGTATSQKLGFFNATPIVQPTGDVITALQNLGLGATLTVLATTITSRTLWGQTYDGSGNVTGSLTAVADITGGASSMAITAGTGNSRTLTLKSTTSGGTATAFLTGNADQSSTFGGNISGTGAWTITGGAGNMTIISGTGASRTLIFQTTTSGSSATTALTLNADQTATFVAAVTAPQNLNTDNAIAASSNAATVPVTSRINTVTNNSAATLTITLATSGAIGGQLVLVKVLDASAVAQTLAWVNTEDSTVTAPILTNGSTTLPLTVGFQYNSSTSKWRCVGKA